ncbi:hypothetical protein LguiA_016019 [Lonicera macranthoides]
MELWFSHWRRSSEKNLGAEPVIGILTFEVACLMLKVFHLWKCLRDKKMVQLREEVITSLGIQKLVSDDEDYLMDLVLAEILETFGYLAKSVARLGKRCRDPAYHHLEHIFDDPTKINLNWRGWEYRSKKMEKKVRKMERFVGVTSQLHQEIEVMAELEQSLRRMQANVDINQVKLFEFQQKVMWQRLEVKSLREMSPWNRTYDYTVRILLRSLFTISERIKYVFGINQTADSEGINDSECDNIDGCLVRSHSISACMQSSIHPSESNLSVSNSSTIGRVSNLNSFNKKLKTHYQSSILFGKHPLARTGKLTHFAPFKGCMMGGSDSPVLLTKSSSMRSSGAFQNDTDKMKDTCSKHRLLNSFPSTLCHAGLALHYANLIILIEKLASFPHLITLDAREDLYIMLPASIRASMRAKLKLFSKTLAASVSNAALVAESSLAVVRILQWLAPLAHNMIRWHAERNFEKKRMVSRTNMLLVQTLYFASQEKTESAITELLIHLTYILRFR